MLCEATPGVTSSAVTTMSRVLDSDAKRFSSEAHTVFETSQESARKSLPADGPGNALGMDLLLQMAIENTEIGEIGQCRVVNRDQTAEVFPG